MTEVDNSDNDSTSDARNLMASYFRKQVLIGKAFAAFVKPKDLDESELAVDQT